jgi:hypothetical protein
MMTLVDRLGGAENPQTNDIRLKTKPALRICLIIWIAGAIIGYFNNYIKINTLTDRPPVAVEPLGDNPSLGDKGLHDTLSKISVAQQSLSWLGQEADYNNGLLSISRCWTYWIMYAVPFMYEFKMHDAVLPPFQTSLLIGDNKADQYSYLMGLSVSQFNSHLNVAIGNLSRPSIDMARDFISGFLSYSSRNAHLDTMLVNFCIDIFGSFAIIIFLLRATKVQFVLRSEVIRRTFVACLAVWECGGVLYALTNYDVIYTIFVKILGIFVVVFGTIWFILKIARGAQPITLRIENKN